MRIKIGVALALVLALVGLSAGPAFAYLGETAFISCSSGSVYTTVLSSHDHHHRLSGVNRDHPGSGSTVYRTYEYWYTLSGQWTTGSYNGSYSYSGSGGGCT